MNNFTEIEGAILESISESGATYISANGKEESLKVKVHSLAFDKGWFEIENPYSIVGGENLNDFIGLKVVEAFSNEDSIYLKFNNDSVVIVSLKDEDFNGPEAASYNPKKGDIIVFN